MKRGAIAETQQQTAETKCARTEEIPEKLYEQFHSVLRRLEHIKTFGDEPQTITNYKRPSRLMNDQQNRNILRVLLTLGSNLYAIIPKEIDHWTSYDNLKSIFRKGAILGNKALSREKVLFEPNTFSSWPGGDGDNLDGNVLCFAPRKFIDPIAFFERESGPVSIRRDRVLIRLNTSTISKAGKYNTFFKITDLCGPTFTKKISINPLFNIKISRSTRDLLNKQISVKFSFNHHKESVHFSKQDCLFYGSFAAINYFCLRLLFQALEKCKNEELVKEIYHYLQNLDDTNLSNIIETFAKGMTNVSEFNIRGILELKPKMIHNVHFVENGQTFHFDQYEHDEDYNEAINKLLDMNDIKKLQSSPEAVLPPSPKDNPHGFVKIYNELLCYNLRCDERHYHFAAANLNDNLQVSANEAKELKRSASFRKKLI